MRNSPFIVTEQVQNRDASNLIKILAVLLLMLAGALMYTVFRDRKLTLQVQQGEVAYEPRVVVPAPDKDKLGSEEQATISAFKNVSPSVTFITTLAARRDRISLDVSEIPQGTGSGFVWDTAGNVVTNFHVVKDADVAEVTLDDGSTYPAKLVGVAPDKDLAVLHIDAPASKLKPIGVGSSADLVVGQKVLAIGNPFGLDHTLTTGVISALGREIVSVTERPIYDVIQTDASINPGNSGGPLLDSSGRLIGINAAIRSPSGANAGIGFAVPVDTINSVVPQLIKHGKVIRCGLGIVPAADQITARVGLQGVLIIDAQAGGAAANAGLLGTKRGSDGKLVLGDLIVAIDGSPVQRFNDMYKVLDSHKVGDVVKVTVSRGGQHREVSLTLQAIP